MNADEVHLEKLKAELAKLSEEIRSLVEIRELGAEKLKAETAKLLAETRNLKKTSFMRFLDHFSPTATATVAIAGVILGVMQQRTVNKTTSALGQSQTAKSEQDANVDFLREKLAKISSRADQTPAELPLPTPAPTPASSPSSSPASSPANMDDPQSIKRIAEAALSAIPGTLLASIKVSNTALPGEDWRASQNFSIALPAGAKKFIFQIPGPPLQDLSFSIAKDKAFAPDPQLATNIRSGSTIDAFSGQDLYIGGVTNAPRSFTVNIYAK